jgi:CubicO group peptidase (beta-lactamase class C family)
MSNHTKLLTLIAGVLVAAGILSSCSSANNEESLVLNSEFDEKVERVVSNGRLPSLQIAVIYENQLVLSKSYGQNVTTDSVYMNGSVQKVLDATAVLQLHEGGLIDLDADISDYIPFQVKHPGYPDTPVTIRMLLAHRSGLDTLDHQFSWDTEYRFSQYRPTGKPEIAEMSLEEFLFASLTPEGSNYNPYVWLARPDDQYHYSVSAYPLLRYVIEKVAGASYPDYMNENILKPLGMLNTGFRSDTLVGQNTMPYTRIGGENIELPVWDGNGYMMRTTAEDMAKFMLAHVNDGRYDHLQLLQPQTIQLMRSKTSPEYGLGLIHYPHGWLGHGGSTVGYQSLWQFNPSRKCGFVIFTNVNGILGSHDDFSSVWENVAEIRDILLSMIDPPATFRSFPWALITASVLTLLVVVLINYRRRRAARNRTR